MFKTILSAAAVALALTACGSDSNQDELANVLLASARAEGIEADEDCIKEVASKLSDDDARKVIDSEGDLDTVELSPEGFSTTAGILNCVDVSTFVDEQITLLQAQGIDFDEQCLRAAFDDVDFSEFGPDFTPPPALQDALLACLGG